MRSGLESVSHGRFLAILGLVLGLSVYGAPAGARSLKDALGEMSLLSRGVGGTSVPFAGEVLGEVIGQLAVRGTDFPVASTVPGLAFFYDPDTQLMMRTSSLGPVFSERADTVGKGRVEIGMSLLYGNLDDVDGGDIGEIRTAYNLGGGLVDSLDVDDFSLQTWAISTYGTYGITDRWDVNLVVPVMYSDLDAEGFGAAGSPGGTTSGNSSAHEDALGIGDILVRTKYSLIKHERFGLAAGLNLRIPTGDEDDFQGLGDTTVTPLLVGSAPIGRHSLHGSLGFEANAGQVDLSRFRYTFGFSVQALERLAILIDILGSSGIAGDELRFRDITALKAPAGVSISNSSTFEVDRTDLIDLATGLKFQLWGNAVGYAGVIVPLNDDGLRATALPTGGFEWSF